VQRAARSIAVAAVGRECRSVTAHFTGIISAASDIKMLRLVDYVDNRS